MLRRIAIALVLLPIAAAAGLVWWASQPGALRWGVERAVAASGGSLEAADVQGSLLRGVRIGRLAWRADPQQPGMTIELRDLRAGLRLRSLLSLEVDFTELAASSARIELGPPSDEPTSLPPALALPVDLRLRSLRVDTLTVAPFGGGDPIELTGVDLEARYQLGSYQIGRLDGDTPWGRAHLEGRISDREPFETGLSALLTLTVAPVPVEVRARARGPLAALDVDADLGTEAAGSARVRARVLPFASPQFESATATVDSLDLAALGLEGVGATRIDGRIELAPEAAAAPAAGAAAAPLALTGRVDLGNGLAGPVDQARIPVTSAAGALRWSAADGLAVDEMKLGLHGGGRIEGRLAIDPARQVTLPGASLPWVAAGLEIGGVDLAALHGALPVSQLAGKLASDGQTFAVDLTDATRSGVALEARGDIDERRLALTRLQFTGGEALGRMRVQASGSVGVTAPHEVALEGRFERFDPSRLQAWVDLVAGSGTPARTGNGATSEPAPAAGQGLAQRLQGTLDGQWSVRGALPATAVASGDGLRVRLQVERGELAGMQARARVDARVLGLATGGVSVDRLRVRDAVVDARLGDTRLEAKGGLGAADDRIDFRLRAPSLSKLAEVLGQPGLAGAVDARGGVRGGFAAPTFDLVAEGSKLALGDDFKAGSLRVELAVPTPARGLYDTGFTVALKARDLASGGTALRSVEASGTGSARDHRFDASLAGAKATLRLAAAGALAETGRWAGVVRELETGGEVVARLTAPMPVEFGPGPDGFEAIVGAGVLAGDLGEIRVERGAWRTGRVELSADARVSSVGRVVAALGLDAGAEAAIDTLDPLSVSVHAEVAGSSIEDVSGRLVARLESPGGASGGGSADLVLADGALSGPLRLEVPTLAFANRLVGPQWSVDGTLRFEGSVGGRLAAPRLVGDLSGAGLRLQQNAMGWRLRDGTLSGRFDGERFRLASMKLYAGAPGDPGSVELSGEVRASDLEGHFDLVADRFGVLIGPGQRVVVSGTARATASGGQFRVEGRLRADEGLIELAGGDAPTLPDDVIVVGENDVGGAQDAGRLQIASDVTLDLGDNLRVRGSGLDARLAGSIRLQGTLPAAPRAYGTVRVRDGRFRAYGQELAITRGQIVFNGPLDNPLLDIVALRRNQQVEAGVAVTGTVLSPQIRLTSRPDVPDAEKLSWLVLGVPLANASAAQGAALQAAAATLFGSNDGGLASTLGLDVLTIRSSSEGHEGLLSSRFGGGGLGSSLPPVPGQVGSTSSVAYVGAAENVVAIGKRLGSRLFVTYEQGLRGVWNLLLIQYDITRRLSLRAQTGTESAIDLIYRFSFD